MAADPRAHLHDIREAILRIRQFVGDKNRYDYLADELLRSAVERKLGIIGEGLVRLRRDAPELLAQIREQRSIIAFRNILVHGYDSIDDRIVWDIAATHLDALYDDVETLLERL